jgi:hypothetical protein
VLSLGTTDLATISTLRISLDVDLRTPSEIAATPDRVPNGAIYANVNVYGTAAPPSVASVTTHAQADWQFSEPVPGICSRSKPASSISHCVDRPGQRRDRTGWTAALLQTIAGVSSATIMKDYLATNLYTAAFIQSSLAPSRRKLAAPPPERTRRL